MHKVARTAGKAAPAVVVLGALAAAPQIHDLMSTAHTTSTGHGTAAPLINSAQGANTEADNPATFKISKYQPRTAATPKPSSSGPAPNSGHSARHSRSASGHSRSASGATSGSSGHDVTTGATSPTCSGIGGTGMLPYNFAAIVDFLTQHGYTGIAASGIAGNIFQESKGNPESVGDGGGGLIGWTPLPAGFVTGNPAADLQTQLEALLTYDQQWAQYIPTLNAATNATDAAYIYMTYFERPGLPVATNREAAADAVAAACGL